MLSRNCRSTCIPFFKKKIQWYITEFYLVVYWKVKFSSCDILASFWIKYIRRAIFKSKDTRFKVVPKHAMKCLNWYRIDNLCLATLLWSWRQKDYTFNKGCIFAFVHPNKINHFLLLGINLTKYTTIEIADSRMSSF